MLLISLELVEHILETVMDVEDTVVQTDCIVGIDDVVKDFFA